MKDTKLTHSDLYPIVEILSQCRSVYNLNELDLVVDQLVNSIENLETITLSACFSDGQTEVVLGDMSLGTDVPVASELLISGHVRLSIQDRHIPYIRVLQTTQL